MLFPKFISAGITNQQAVFHIRQQSDEEMAFGSKEKDAKVHHKGFCTNVVGAKQVGYTTSTYSDFCCLMHICLAKVYSALPFSKIKQTFTEY
jgi:hypothetical protein